MSGATARQGIQLAFRVLAAPASAMIAVITPANAQTNPYGQYDAYGQSAQGSPMAGYGDQETGANPPPGQGSALPGAAAPANTPTPEYSPLVIPNPTAQPSSDTPTVPVTRPDQSGALPPPLYARPGANPGEFKLYTRPPPPLNDFEKYVAETLGRPLPRFGSSLVLTGGRGFVTAPTATVPPDYALNPGDELLIGVTGAVEADLRLVIDSEGRIFVPRIGPINIAGVRYGDLAAALQRRFDQQYKKTHVSVVIGRLHGITVYVTGYAVSPGTYTVSSLSTLVDAVLAAGGPTAGGSYRSIQLRRGGHLVTDLDLYDLLLNGDKTHDAILQNEDVLNIGPTGPELAITGAVNAEAIYEAKAGETLGDTIRYAGGFNSLADEGRVVISRLADLDATGSRQLTIAEAKHFPAERGDIVRVLSLAGVARPLERQAILATIEGEVDRPGRYYLQPGSTVADLLARAGGLTSSAFVFGTHVDRQGLKREEQESFDKAISNLELTAAALPLSASVLEGGPTLAQVRSQGALAIIERLKGQKPEGRLVLDLAPNATALPAQLALENNDRIFIPPQPKVVGVFGAVYQTGSFLYRPGSRISDYMKLAGGPQKIADRGDVFVVRANGAVVSKREIHDLTAKSALPGDVVFVPVKASAGLLDKILAGVAALYPLGVNAATLVALGL